MQVKLKAKRGSEAYTGGSTLSCCGPQIPTLEMERVNSVAMSLGSIFQVRTEASVARNESHFSDSHVVKSNHLDFCSNIVKFSNQFSTVST